MIDPQQREKCLKEVRLLESLNHPHIVSYLDSFIADNELLIAIEWAERGDLKRVIKRAQSDEAPIEESRIWDYMYQIASALHHMHQKRIMHRDLKPANIFIAADESLKLGDLGLGRYFATETIEAFSRVGTPLYMSPEVLRSQGYDWKSDVWSLGCVIYELASLRSPFRKENVKMSLYDLFNAINKGEYPPLPERYSEELKQLVYSMIQVDPSLRLNIPQVLELCQIHISSHRRPKIDPFLIMDDVHVKLSLLDYENTFCKKYRRPPVNRVYFAVSVDPDQQLAYLYDLVYWLMQSSKSVGPVLDYSSFAGRDAVASQITSDLRVFGVKIPEIISMSTLKQGFGEGACFILNDLLNRELTIRNFDFKNPVVREMGSDVYMTTPTYKEEYAEEIDVELPEECIMKYSKFSDSSEGEEEVKEENPIGPIETQVDPQEWYQEVERVAPDLKVDVPRADESHIDIILEQFKAVQGLFPPELLEKFSLNVERWDESLRRIREGEENMNKRCSQNVAELQGIIKMKRQLANRLNSLRDVVKAQVEEFDRLRGEEQRTLKNIEGMTGYLNDRTLLNEAKEKLVRVRQEAKAMQGKEAVARIHRDSLHKKYNYMET